MIDIRTEGLDRLQRNFSELARQTPAVAARAINDTAFKVMAEERAAIARAFDKPKPWVAKNVRAFKATTDNLGATVGATDYFERGGLQAKGTAWERILAPHVYGGSRLAKASERRLQMAGLLPSGWFTVPGQGAKLDSYGNMSPGEIVAILSWVGAMGQYAGDNTNKRDRLTRRRNAAERRNEAYFVARVGNRQGIQPGIYKRFGRTRTIKPMLIFVNRATYRPRLDWYGIGNATIAREFPSIFARHFREQLI